MFKRAHALFVKAAAFSLFAVPSTANAWVESHVVSDDVRITLSRDAPAKVEHRITVRIAGGPLRTLDIRGVDGDAEPESEAFVVTERDAATKSLASAREVTAELIPPDNKPSKDGSPQPTILRLRLGEKGIGRGTYVVQVRYKTRLAERGFIKHDGTIAQVRWKGPVWEDGFDSARVTFDLPSAPAAPRTEERATGSDGDDGAAPLVLSTVRRKGERDEIELLRPYVPVGEAITWTVVADGRAFDRNAGPPNSPANAKIISISQVTGDAANRFRVLWLGAFAVGFLGWAFLLARKVREVTVGALLSGTKPAPLIPCPLLVRAPVSAVLVAAGVWLQVVKHAWTPSAFAILLALLLVVHRPAPWPKSVFLRKPGRWLPISEKEAWAPAPRKTGTYLDVSTRAGKVLLVLGLAVFGGLTFLASETSRHLAAMVALDSTLLLGLFGTGLLSHLPPSPKEKAAPFLHKVEKRLLKKVGDTARLIPRVRVPDGGAEPDELRLAVVPRPATQGFKALEAGIVVVPGMGGPAVFPSVLLRYLAGSPCEEQLSDLVRAGKVTRGRKAGEVAVVFSPRLPTARMTADLTARLADAVRLRKVDLSASDNTPTGVRLKTRSRKAA